MSVDAAAYVGQWPFRPIEGTIADLTSTMRSNRVKQAIVSPLAGLFHADPGPANARLLRRLAGRRRLWAAPVISLRMADWSDQMETLAGKRQVRAVRLAPSFHGYTVAEAGEAAELAGELGLAVVVQLRMEDERHLPPFMTLPQVPLDDVVALAAAAPRARVVASAARLGEVANDAEHIRQLRNLWLDVSHFDGLECIRQARDAVGARRLLFSSCWPFFYARSAVMKVEEAEVAARDREAMMEGNARAAFGIG